MTRTLDRIHSASAAFGRAAAWLGRMVVRSIVATRMRQLARTLRHRREAGILAGLDEAMLADIGLSRADLRDAFAEPIWRDPTSVLVQRADERRGWRGGGRAAGSRPSMQPGMPACAPPLERAAGQIV